VGVGRDAPAPPRLRGAAPDLPMVPGIKNPGTEMGEHGDLAGGTQIAWVAEVLHNGHKDVSVS
jgi:hypothetical protein